MRIKAYFEGKPGGVRDKACRKIFEEHNGDSIGAGTNLMTGVRDVEYDVPLADTSDCKAALKKAGFHLNPNF